MHGLRKEWEGDDIEREEGEGGEGYLATTFTMPFDIYVLAVERTKKNFGKFKFIRWDFEFELFDKISRFVFLSISLKECMSVI